MSHTTPPLDTRTESREDDNPCVRNCCLDTQDICLGCGRSLVEILEWRDADSKRRREINTLALTRRQQRPALGDLIERNSD